MRINISFILSKIRVDKYIEYWINSTQFVIIALKLYKTFVS